MEVLSARTAGVQVEVIDHHDAADVVEAIEAFVEAEAAFLSAVSRFASEETQSVLGCALWVFADEPVALAVPPETLGRLAREGIVLEVSGYPRTDD